MRRALITLALAALAMAGLGASEAMAAKGGAKLKIDDSDYARC